MGRNAGREGGGGIPLVLIRTFAFFFFVGVVLKGVGQTSFSSQVRTVTFEDVPPAYKPGIPFQGKVAAPVRDSLPSRPCGNSEFRVAGR